MHDISITRLQILMTLRIAVMKYKVQQTIFQIVVLDLYMNTKLENKGLHKRFYSTYI